MRGLSWWNFFSIHVYSFRFSAATQLGLPGLKG